MAGMRWGGVASGVWVIVAVYAIMSLLTLIVYTIDKRAAHRGRRRFRERTLHVLELLGGWPGALVAQQLLRHKRRKTNFFLVTWLIAAAHIAAWVWVWYRNSHP